MVAHNCDYHIDITRRKNLWRLTNVLYFLTALLPVRTSLILDPALPGQAHTNNYKLS